MTLQHGGIDAPATIQEGTTTFEVTVSEGDEVIVTSDQPVTRTDYRVNDGKVTVTVPPGATAGTIITISNWGTPPRTAQVEIVSTF